jgi:glycine cleavage system aminomethyltransferase T/glycine/D-amino acid oxidase-like deaminating enzyme
VVIGGGVGGCSILYWLTRLGWDDVVLVERADLTSGSTFHSAGLVGQLRSSLALTRMMMSSVELYRTLAAEVGLETGWREVGSLRLASSPERLEEITRQAGWAKTFGLPLELISAAEAQALFPPMTTDGVLGAAFLPSDGYIDPSQLTFALAEGARRRGAEVNTGTRVTGITVERGAVTGVETERGVIETEIVVDAGGMYAREIGALAGVNVPIIPMAHEYLVLQPAGLPTEMPTMRDPSLLVYFRPESGGLIMGGYERRCAPWSLDGIPPDFNGKLLEEDWPRFEELMQNAIVRVPTLEGMGVVKLINGPEAFTPDGEFILGPSEVRGFWVAAGFCAHGLAGAGGMGQLVAEWIVEGTPSLDVWHMDSRRFGAAYRSRDYTLARTAEIYETYYDVKYPGHERSAGRPLRVSPAYERLVGLGASFGEKSGWERANWFEPNASRGDESLRPRGWAGKLWSAAIGAEHRACREAVAVFDESSFAKIDVTGPGSAAFLESLCANRVARDVGAVTYTQMLNARGGIECDFTVTRLGEERFRIVTGTAFGQHDLAWIRQHAPRDGSVQLTDVTSAYACFGVWGPNARALLQPLTTADLSSGAFPYLTAQEISVGAVPCLAVRVTYVGELGWELYSPSEYGARLWDTVWAAADGHGLVAGGYKAIDSLRLEKGYRVWGADITPEDSPFAAGLGFAVKLDKGDFLGRAALLARG